MLLFLRQRIPFQTTFLNKSLKSFSSSASIASVNSSISKHLGSDQENWGNAWRRKATRIVKMFPERLDFTQTIPCTCCACFVIPSLSFKARQFVGNFIKLEYSLAADWNSKISFSTCRELHKASNVMVWWCSEDRTGWLDDILPLIPAWTSVGQQLWNYLLDFPKKINLKKNFQLR